MFPEILCKIAARIEDIDNTGLISYSNITQDLKKKKASIHPGKVFEIMGPEFLNTAAVLKFI
jgi:hypothetical protein